jgi:hypothetical protein
MATRNKATGNSRKYESDCGSKTPRFLNLGTNGGEWSAPRTGRFTFGEGSPTRNVYGSELSLDSVQKQLIALLLY